MENFKNFETLQKIKFYEQHGYKMVSDNFSYFRSKNTKVRMFDSNHVIKKSGSKLEYLEELKKLNIEGINSPEKILFNEIDNSYFLVSPYLKECMTLGYYVGREPSMKDIVIIIDKVLALLEKCHNNDFYVIDMNDLNILINNANDVFFYDFDTSCFIKNNELISTSDDVNAYAKDVLIKYVLLNYYNYKIDNDYDVNYYQDKFMFVDKFQVIFLLIDYFLNRLQIGFDYFEYIEHPGLIKKIGFGKNFENKILQIIKGVPLESNNYFHDELQELAESRFIRKRKFR